MEIFNIEIPKKIIYSIIIVIVLLILYTICQLCGPEKITLRNVRKYIEKQEKINQPFEPIIIKNVLSNDEINTMINNSKFHDSETIGDSSNIRSNTTRVSQTSWYDNRNLITKLVKAIDPKKTYEHCEKLQVVKYNKGGFFVPHFDSTHNPYNNYTYDFKKGGHREYTLMIALSNPAEYEGGHTQFTNLNKSYKLEKGDGLVFRNIDKNHNILQEYKHGGNPVTSGVKMICNLWIHVDRYNFNNDFNKK